jgi:hypothetical protein
LPNKSLALTILVIAVMVACAGLFAGFLGQSAEPNMGPVEEKLRLQNCSAEKDSGALNISLTVKAALGESVPINDFQINSVSQTELGGVAIYVNGTAIATDAAPLVVVESGDVLVVNLVLPSAFSGEPFDGGFVRVEAVTRDVRYYTETTYK